MAISYVGGATAVSTGNTDVSVSLTALAGGSDSAPSSGDLIIFAYNIADADNADLNMACNTASFAEIADLFGNGTQDANLGVYWKFFGSETAVVGEGSLGGTDTAIQAAAMVFRGVNAGVPFNTALVPATGTTGGTPNPPEINPDGTAGVWTVIVGSNAHTANANGTFTAPANYTTDFLTIGNQDTADGIIGMGYNSAPSDPENPGTMTSSHTATGWCAVTIALNPSNPQAVTPTTASLTITLFAPTVTVTNHVNVTPATATLTISLFAPTVAVTANQNVIPSTLALTLTTFAPTVTVGLSVTPTPATLTVATFAPTVTVTANQLVTPSPATLTITTFAPTVTATAHQFVTPAPAALTLTLFAPTVTTTQHVFVTPLPATLTLTLFAPTVEATGGPVGPPDPGTVPIRYILGTTANVVPVLTVGVWAIGVVRVREFVGPANVVPVREVTTETPHVKVVKV